MSDNGASCCCNCRHRLVLREKQRGPPPIGWVCIALAFTGIAYKGDFEHGLCEFFARQEKENLPQGAFPKE